MQNCQKFCTIRNFLLNNNDNNNNNNNNNTIISSFELYTVFAALTGFSYYLQSYCCSRIQRKKILAATFDQENTQILSYIGDLNNALFTQYLLEKNLTMKVFMATR